MCKFRSWKKRKIHYLSAISSTLWQISKDLYDKIEWKEFVLRIFFLPKVRRINKRTNNVCFNVINHECLHSHFSHVSRSTNVSLRSNLYSIQIDKVSYLIGEKALADSYHRMLPAMKRHFKANNLNICTRINKIIGLLWLQVQIGNIGSQKSYTSRFW